MFDIFMLDYYGREGYLFVSDGIVIFFNKEVYVWVMEEFGYFIIDCNGRL